MRTVPAFDVALDDTNKRFETNFFGVTVIVWVFMPLLSLSKELKLLISTWQCCFLGSPAADTRSLMHIYMHIMAH